MQVCPPVCPPTFVHLGATSFPSHVTDVASMPRKTTAPRKKQTTLGRTESGVVAARGKGQVRPNTTESTLSADVNPQPGGGGGEDSQPAVRRSTRTRRSSRTGPQTRRKRGAPAHPVPARQKMLMTTTTTKKRMTATRTSKPPVWIQMAQSQTNTFLCVQCWKQRKPPQPPLRSNLPQIVKPHLPRRTKAAVRISTLTTPMTTT